MTPGPHGRFESEEIARREWCRRSGIRLLVERVELGIGALVVGR